MTGDTLRQASLEEQLVAVPFVRGARTMHLAWMHHLPHIMQCRSHDYLDRVESVEARGYESITQLTRGLRNESVVLDQMRRGAQCPE